MNYTSRSIDQMVQDTYTYANWSTINNNAKMTVEGSFFDEIPGLYDWRNCSYLTKTHNTVKVGAETCWYVVPHVD